MKTHIVQQTKHQLRYNILLDVNFSKNKELYGTSRYCE